MLAIPATTTQDSYVAATSFPGLDGGGTPYVQGFLFVANNSAQISIKKGKLSGASGVWTPDSGVAPTLIPLVADRSTQNPDYIFGVRVKSLVAGSQAVFFGALFQQGEIAFIPSAQFAGSVSSSGGFTPVGTGMITGIIPATGTVPTAGTGFTYTHVNTSGVYVFTFTTPFAAPPVILSTSNDTRANDKLWGVTAVTAAGFTLTTWTASTAAAADAPFSFVAIPAA